jgi:hypothetical protein
MAFDKVIEDACSYVPVREHNNACHLGTEALVDLKRLVFQLGDYDSNAKKKKKIYSFSLVL